MRLFIASLCVLILASVTFAQHICRGRNVASAVVVPVHAPAYVPAVKSVVVDDSHHAVKAVKVFAAPDYYYSVSDGYRDSLLADAIAFRVLALQQKGLLRGPGETAPVPRFKDGAGAPTRPSPSAPAGGVAAPAPVPVAGGAVPAGLAELVEKKCLKCHVGDKNGIDLTALASVPEGGRWKSYALANSGEMPKGAAAISDDEVKLFYEWAKAAGAVARK